MSDNMVKTNDISEENIDNSTSNIPIEVGLSLFIGQFRTGIWLLGIPSWLFGITDRSFSAFTDGYLSPIEVFQLLTASFFFMSWLYLKPDNSLDAISNQVCLCPIQANNYELRKRHMISQEYILPFPYHCQIYHLLNLKHLETVHSFSLSSLRILQVSHFQATSIGGIIKFQTILDSPINPLRIWRQPIVEVDLILHNPYTVELSIPVYDNKRITVIFIALPLTENEHQFFIEIYSDLGWPKPLLQILLHFASCLTLFEDLPYLRNLAEVNIERLFKINKFSNHSSMLLFQRFVELYGATIESTKLIEGK